MKDRWSGGYREGCKLHRGKCRNIKHLHSHQFPTCAIPFQPRRYLHICHGAHAWTSVDLCWPLLTSPSTHLTEWMIILTILYERAIYIDEPYQSHAPLTTHDSSPSISQNKEKIFSRSVACWTMDISYSCYQDSSLDLCGCPHNAHPLRLCVDRVPTYPSIPLSSAVRTSSNHPHTRTHTNQPTQPTQPNQPQS